MIPTSSSYNLQGMSTLNFNNLLANSSQTTQATLPLSALGNILQLHCNPSLTLQVNGPSPLIPISTKENNSQDHLSTFRNIFPTQTSYQNILHQDQCTNTSPRSFNQLIQELLSSYQNQQDSLSQITIKYNFLLNAMERLLFDVQNSVEYSLLALGISQTISKVKLNQLNQLNQLSCPSLISNGIIPMINQAHIFNSYSQAIGQQPETTPISSSGIDLTNQRTRSESVTATSIDKKSDTSHSESNISVTTFNSKPPKMTSLDKLDKLIDETVKKSTGRSTAADCSPSPLTMTSLSIQEDNHQSNVIDVNVNMGNAIHQIIRQFYQNASTNLNNNNNGLIESCLATSQHSTTRVPSTDHLKMPSNSFSQQAAEIFNTSQIPFNSLANRPSQSFILCNNLPTSSFINGHQREPFVVSMSGSCSESNQPIVVDSLNEPNNPAEDTESTSNHEEEELCSSELDPTEVATKIRDILSLHSIGQRLFAKHVLNLSQGTVSELLSKPKPWSKLSEKGRDSYRKMNQWAQDASKVQELKLIAPRKGFSGHYAGMSPATPIKEDHETQEKIKRILNDAKMAMASTNSQISADEEIFSCYKKSNEPPTGNGSSEGSQLTAVLCNSIQSGTNPVTNVLEFDISELQKKITAALHSTPVSNTPRLEPLPQISTSTSYQQSPLIVMNLSNLVSYPSSLMVSSVQTADSSIGPMVSTIINPNIDDKYGGGGDYHSTQNTPFEGPENHHIKAEVSYTNEEENKTDTGFESRAETKSLGENNFSKNSGPKSITDLKNLENFLKSFIGSIKLTENCFKNEEVNTSELVNVVKDHLTKNSISQRTFGCLLGLSQGTVSDILSRPKPWSMLTNKGREPYIRMLKYLLKPTYFKVTDASTNKANLVQNTLIESLPNSSSSPSSSHVALTYDNAAYDEKNDYNSHMSDRPDNDECNLSTSTEGREYQSWDEDIPNINVDVYGSPILNMDHLQTENFKFDDPKEIILNISTRIVNMNTEELASEIKEILNNNNIGLRVFEDFILHVCQASMGELLTKPKKWNQLSLRSREPYVRMYLWLKQPDRVQILNKSLGDKKGQINGVDSYKNVSNILKKEPNESNSDLHSEKRHSADSGTSKIVLTDLQVSKLKNVFEKCPYPKADQLCELSKRLEINPVQVGNWFHNQRMRIRSKIDPKNENQSCLSINKLESLSGESEVNSEKSLSMTIDEMFDVSDSDNSISAPHLYPESNLLEYNTNVYEDKMDDEDDNENGNFSTINQPSSTVAGSNKRKRTNPIKLEMVVNKIISKDVDEYDSTKNIHQLNQSTKMTSHGTKVPRLDPNTI